MELTDWLLRQIPVVIVMGIVIYYMYNYIKKKDEQLEAKEKERNATVALKDDAIMQMAEKVLSVASLWDVKSDLNTKEHEEIMKSLHELQDFAKTCKYGKQS